MFDYCFNSSQLSYLQCRCKTVTDNSFLSMTSHTAAKITLLFLRVFMACVEIVYVPIHIYRFFKHPKKCPPIKDSILLLSASELAERIRNKKITSLAVVEAYITRINEVNPIINAVIENRFQAARHDAKCADEFIRNSGLNSEEIEQKYPLLGVPITIKGSIAVAGMIHSAGRVNRSVKAEIDGTAVKYAKDAGAIPLLTSNVPELCLNWETTNKLIGTTSNPYNNCLTPGGSSGGEASLIGSAASVVGIGSDIAGSLRLPAHYCGIWGHKPSPKTVSPIGHYPDCKQKDEWNEVFTLGPLARYAKDLKLLLSIIAEPTVKNNLRLHELVDVKKLKIHYIREIDSVLTSRVDNDISRAVDAVVNHFDTICDIKCKEVDTSLIKYCTWLSYLRLLNIDDVENIFDNKGNGAYLELFQFFRGKSIHEVTSIFYGILRRNRNLIPIKSMNEVKKFLGKVRKDLIKLLGDDGVFIVPTNPTVATYHGDIFRNLFNPSYCSIFNAWGFPVTNCPITFSKNGLPIGIQVAAAPNMDRLSLAVAEELETAFGGWKF